MEFKMRLKLLRIEAGLRQEDVATQIGITPNAYGNIESGKSNPTLITFIKLATFYKVSLDYLIGRTEKREV